MMMIYFIWLFHLVVVMFVVVSWLLAMTCMEIISLPISHLPHFPHSSRQKHSSNNIRIIARNLEDLN